MEWDVKPYYTILYYTSVRPHFLILFVEIETRPEARVLVVVFVFVKVKEGHTPGGV